MERKGGLGQMIRARVNGQSMHRLARGRQVVLGYPSVTSCSSIRQRTSGGALCWVALMGLALLAGSEQAMAQFVVNPMMIEARPQAGQRVETEIQLQNWDATETQYITLSTVSLTQDENGNWQVIDANHPVDPSKIHSCKEWISISQKKVTVLPAKTVSVPIVIRPANGSRGFWCAGIVCSLDPRRDAIGVTVKYEFVVPVLVTMDGPATYNRVMLVDAGLETFKDVDGTVGNTVVTLTIENTGQTYSRLIPRAQVFVPRANNDSQLVIREVKFSEVAIVPGSRLKIKGDCGRCLPSKTYLVRGFISVDGKPPRRIETKVSYTGEKAAKDVTDAAVEVDPATVVIDSLAGGTGRSMVEVRNDSDQPVTIRVHLATPGVFGGHVSPSGLRGESMSCSDWVDVNPSEFTLQGYRTQKIQLTSRMPASATESRGYYADLNLFASYSDGTNAGAPAHALVCVTNKRVPLSPVVNPKKIAHEPGESQKWTVLARFQNVGNAHVKPYCEAQLVRPDGVTILRAPMVAQDKPDLMLPLEPRDFSGELDLTNLRDAGFYRIAAVLTDQSVSDPNEFPPVIQDEAVQVTRGADRKWTIERVGLDTFRKEAGKVGGTVKW
jgi:hypothetical protein